jgi:hypothetical protein
LSSACSFLAHDLAEMEVRSVAMPALFKIFLYPLAYPKEKELIAMEVHFTPEVQAKLDQMARESGRRSDELL